MNVAFRVVMMGAMLALCSLAQAGTVYVAEGQRAALRAEATDTGATVKAIEPGVALEEIERVDRFVHVRDPQGAEGWIEARYLGAEPAARPPRAKPQQDELAKSRAQTAEAQAQLKKTQAAMAELEARIKELEQAATDKLAQSAAAPVPPPPAPTVGETPQNTSFLSVFLWLGFSFAMLIIGFIAGMKWLRESIRKRSGGMYLRI